MYRSFVCRICRFNNIFQNNLPDVGALQALNKVAGIVGTSGDDDASEQHANQGSVKETPTRVYRSIPAVKQIKTESRIAASCVAKVLYCFFSSISIMVLLYWIIASTVMASTRIKQ